MKLQKYPVFKLSIIETICNTHVCPLKRYSDSKIIIKSVEDWGCGQLFILYAFSSVYGTSIYLIIFFDFTSVLSLMRPVCKIKRTQFIQIDLKPVTYLKILFFHATNM
jgi:hypothetical protein